MMSITQVKPNTTASKAADFDGHTHSMLDFGRRREEETNNYIVTPWDIVMKTLKSDSMSLRNSVDLTID